MKPVIGQVAIRGEQCHSALEQSTVASESVNRSLMAITERFMHTDGTIEPVPEVAKQTYHQYAGQVIIMKILLSFSSVTLSLALVNFVLKMYKKCIQKKPTTNDQVHLQSCTNPSFELNEL